MISPDGGATVTPRLSVVLPIEPGAQAVVALLPDKVFGQLQSAASGSKPAGSAECHPGILNGGSSRTQTETVVAVVCRRRRDVHRRRKVRESQVVDDARRENAGESGDGLIRPIDTSRPARWQAHRSEESEGAVAIVRVPREEIVARY